MATRFYFRENGTAPITPNVDAAWESSAAPFARKPMFTTTDGTDTLTTVTGFTSTTGQDRCHRQLISQPMAAGITFNTGVTYKCYVQALESAVNDNAITRLGIRILSLDGTTVRHTVLAVANYGNATEFNTAIRNKIFADGDAGTGSYVTVAGDRLVVEIGHNDSAGASISVDSRWGSAGSTDLGENETSTSTTERPWFETSVNITFLAPLDDNEIEPAGGVLNMMRIAATTAALAAAFTAQLSASYQFNDDIVEQPPPAFEDDTPPRTILGSSWNAPMWIQAQSGNNYLTVPAEDKYFPGPTQPWTINFVPIWDDSNDLPPAAATIVEDEYSYTLTVQPNQWLAPVIGDDGNDLPVAEVTIVDDDAGLVPPLPAPQLSWWLAPVISDEVGDLYRLVDTDFYLPPAQRWGWPVQTVIDDGMDLGNLHADPAIVEDYGPISGYAGWVYQPVPIVEQDYTPPITATMEEDEYSYPLTTWPLQWNAPLVIDGGSDIGNLHANPVVDEDFGHISKYVGWEHKPVPIVEGDSIFRTMAEEEYNYPRTTWPLQWLAPVVLDDGNDLGNLHTNPAIDEDFGWISKYTGWQYKSAVVVDGDFVAPVAGAIVDEDYRVVLPAPQHRWTNPIVAWDYVDRVEPLGVSEDYHLTFTVWGVRPPHKTLTDDDLVTQPAAPLGVDEFPAGPLPRPNHWWTNRPVLWDQADIFVNVSLSGMRLEGEVVEFLSQGTAAPAVQLHGIAGEFLSQGVPPHVELSGIASEFLYELPPLPVRVTTMFESFIGWQTGVAEVSWLHQEFVGHGPSLGEVTWVHVDVLRTFEPLPPECPTTPYECVEAETPPYACVQVSPFACVGLQPEVRIVVEEVCPPIEGLPLPGSETPPEEGPPAVESVTIVSPMSPIMSVGQTYMLTVQVLGVPNPGDQSPPLSGRTVQFVSDDISVATVLAFATTDQNGYAIVPVIAMGVGTFTVAFQCEGVSGEPLVGTVQATPPETIDGYGSVEIGLVASGAGSFVALQPGQGSVSIGVVAAGTGIASAPPAFGQVFIGVTAVGAGIFIPPASPPPEISGTANVTIGLVASGAGAFTPLQPGEGAVAIGVVAAGSGVVVDPPAHGAVSIGVVAAGAGVFTPAPPPPIVVMSVVVSPCPTTGSVGGTIVLNANPQDSIGNHVVGVTINWVSSNPAVATVSADDGTESHGALVRFLAVGSAIISATSVGP